MEPVVFSDENPDSISTVMAIVFVRGDPVVKHLNPAFAIQRHTTPTAGVMVWGAISYNTRSLLVFIRGTMAAQWYVHNILQPHMLPLMQRPPGTIFQQDKLGLIRQGYHKTIPARLLLFFSLPYPQICLQPSIYEIIWGGELYIPRV
ncbi:UNVERIFIED_CONTAM: hypothetical protein NCL1_57480 [Trichonephila clavipes]